MKRSAMTDVLPRVVLPILREATKSEKIALDLISVNR